MKHERVTHRSTSAPIASASGAAPHGRGGPLFVGAFVALAAASLAPAARAQDPGSGGGEPAPEGAAAPNVTVVQVPAPTTTVVTPGYPQPGFDPNAHLPSSSRGTLDTSRSTDTFDLAPRSTGPVSVRGTEAGSYVVEGAYIPEAHTVRRGDTLWEISAKYYQNGYQWPRIWSYNPQIQNPHWIYPGDRVRLREPGRPTLGDIGVMRTQRVVPPQTIFLRDVGWLEDREEDAWGEIVGSPDDQMLLSTGDDAYIRIEGDHPIALGQELTLYRPLGTGNIAGRGELVSIRGTARVERYNPRTKMIRAKIIEALDVIERGAKVGPLGRRFDVVPPRTAEVDLETRIVASLWPHVYYAQNQVVFLEKGEKDGLRPGNRLFAVRRGDRWVETLEDAGKDAKLRARHEDDRNAKFDEIDPDIDPELLPDETYAEVRVLRVRDHSAVAIVTASTFEIPRGALLIMRKGY